MTTPEAADVVVLGGGLAGSACAALLAEEGAQVVLLERSPSGGLGFSDRTHGVVGLGYADHPVRLTRSLGEEVAAALVCCSAENLRLVREWGLLFEDGHLTASLGPTEEPEMALSIELLERWGLPVEALDPEAVAARLGARGFGSGWWDPRGGAVDPAAAMALVRARACRAGVTWVGGATVSHTRDGRPETEVHGRVADGPFVVKADVVVHAAGFGEHLLDPFFADKLYPVRFQLQRIRGGEGLPALSSQLSYLQGAPRPDGSYVLGGCRWATPHLEAGESDPEVLSDAVDARIESVRTGLLGTRLGGGVVEERSAGIMTFTCDGLPIVGPIPGRVGHLACVGWNGRPWSHALRAATAIRDGLMTGRSEGWPVLLQPNRFV